jgi:mRNA interferase HigB
MRIIARRTLLRFVGQLAGHRDQRSVKNALDAWFDEVRKATWTSASDVKKLYATASLISAERIVFNIKGNDYRLVVAVITKRVSSGSNGSARMPTTIVSRLRR